MEISQWPEIEAFNTLALPAVKLLLSLQADLFTVLHSEIIVPLIEACRMDTRMLHATVDFVATRGNRKQLVMTVHAEPAQTQRLTLDGEARPAYRVGSSNDWTRVVWLSWEGSQFGREAGKQFPVYVQSHALRQLHARVNVPGFAEYAEWWLHVSLANPTIVERSGNDLLVEYHIDGARVGYLVVTPMSDCVVVRTFLFVTMQPSPEARKLERKLRVTRADADWLGLNTMAAFTQTDLRDDPVLRPLLEQCGCGQLFELADAEGTFLPAPKPFAAEVKKYLRLAA